MNARRSGFALLAVLWMMVALTALVAGGMKTIRVESQAAVNRVTLERGAWAARACLAVALSRYDSLASAGDGFQGAQTDSLQFSSNARCRVTSQDPSAFLHRDSATPEMLMRLDSAVLAAATLPRDSFLTTESDGAVNVNVAPGPVLAALPGFDAVVVAAVLEKRAARRSYADLGAFIASIPRPQRDSLERRFGELARVTSFRTMRLLVSATGLGEGRPAPVATVDALIRQLGNRVAVTRRRAW